MTNKIYISKLSNYFNQYLLKLLSYLNYLSTTDKLRFLELIKQPKKDINQKGEYGYYMPYPNTIVSLIKTLKYYKVSNLVDLGSGLGFTLVIIREALGISVRGIEIEKLFLTFANNNTIPTVEGDILKPLEIKNNEAVYFYEPFVSSELSKKFVRNLEKSLPKDTLVFYIYSGSMLRYLIESKHFKKCKQKKYKEGLYIFKKI